MQISDTTQLKLQYESNVSVSNSICVFTVNGYALHDSSLSSFLGTLGQFGTGKSNGAISPMRTILLPLRINSPSYRIKERAESNYVMMLKIPQKVRLHTLSNFDESSPDADVRTCDSMNSPTACLRRLKFFRPWRSFPFVIALHGGKLKLASAVERVNRWKSKSHQMDKIASPWSAGKLIKPWSSSSN